MKVKEKRKSDERVEALATERERERYHELLWISGLLLNVCVPWCVCVCVCIHSVFYSLFCARKLKATF